MLRGVYLFDDQSMLARGEQGRLDIYQEQERRS